MLAALGRVDDGPARAELRRYVAEGRRWLEVLELIAHEWPRELWEDLFPTAVARSDDAEVRFGVPWTAWADRDPRFAAPVHKLAPSPYAAIDTPGLPAVLRDPAQVAERRAVLRELRRRPPELAVLELADDLVTTESGYPLTSVVGRLGRPGLPYARIWPPPQRDHPLSWTAVCLLAEHGERSDVPALLAALDWLDTRDHDLCGYDTLVTGLARIGGPEAQTARRRIRRLWFSPHSLERAGYLRARMALEPDDCAMAVFEGLWDCESDVRLIAAQHVPLDDKTRDRLRYLRDDPLETDSVRDAAATRLGSRPGRVDATVSR